MCQFTEFENLSMWIKAFSPGENATYSIIVTWRIEICAYGWWIHWYLCVWIFYFAHAEHNILLIFPPHGLKPHVIIHSAPYMVYTFCTLHAAPYILYDDMWFKVQAMKSTKTPKICFKFPRTSAATKTDTPLAPCYIFLIQFNLVIPFFSLHRRFSCISPVELANTPARDVFMANNQSRIWWACTKVPKNGILYLANVAELFNLATAKAFHCPEDA